LESSRAETPGREKAVIAHRSPIAAERVPKKLLPIRECQLDLKHEENQI
jgi:hypothetical protein